MKILCKCGCSIKLNKYDEYGRFREFIHGHNRKGLEFNNVGYFGLHDWIERKCGKAKDKQCSECSSNRNLTWANVSHTYKRELTDWLIMCKKCHFKYDKQDERLRDYHGRLI